VSAAALEAGALLPIETTHEEVEDRGVPFVVRVVDNLARKDRERKAILVGDKSVQPDNPFLPYDGSLYVGHLAPAHVVLLNKFNVLDDHVLIVTESFEHQERLLTMEDLEALWRCLAEGPALAFYNGGVVAGASQAHKHLQLVPLPLLPEAQELPVEVLLAEAPEATGALLTAPSIPFAHRLARLASGLGELPAEAARVTLDLYLAMLDELEVAHADGRQQEPYNLLMTREWMLMVPRSEECFEGISVNSIGYAGGLLVRTEAELEAVRSAGPMAILEHASRPR